MIVFLRRLVSGLQVLRHKRHVEADLDDELRAYFEASVAAKMAAGLPRKAAERAARVEFGSAESVKDRVRDVGWESWAAGLWRDVRFACRTLAKSPTFTLAAIVTVAIGIGANATMATVVNYLLKPLPVPNADELVALASTQERSSRVFQRLAYPDFEDYRTATTVFQGLAAWDMALVGLHVDGRTDRLLAAEVGGSYFSVLGVGPAIGRLLDDRDDALGGPVNVVLGHHFWTREFGADPDIVGRPVRVDGRTATVVGVAPEGFSGTFTLTRFDLYLPLRTMKTSGQMTDRDDLTVRVLGRLHPTSTRDEAQATVDVVAARLAEEHKTTNAGRRVRVFPQRLAGIEPQNAPLLVGVSLFLMVAVGAVMLIACMNVLGLFLARTLERGREIAIRAALGASRWQLARLGLLESVLICALGGLLGGLAGLALAKRVGAMAVSPGFPIYLDLSPDWRVFSYVLMLLMWGTMLVAVLPALQASRSASRSGLAEGRAMSTGRKKQRIRQGLAVVQTAGSVVLLVVCGLFARTVANLASTDLGFDGDRVLVASIDPAALGYDEARASSLYQTIEAELARLPSVASVAEAGSVPFGNGGSTSYVAAAEAAPPTSATGVLADRVAVTAQYFDTIGVPVHRGRGFGRADIATTPAVAVVNDAMAIRLWPGQDAIGKRFRTGGDVDSVVTVVGLVPDAKYRREELDGPARARYFLSLEQLPARNRILHVRSVDGDAAGLETDVRRVLREADSAIPITDVFTLAHQVKFGSGGFAGERGLSLVTGVLGVVGLVLTLVGTYGVLAFTVGQRTREFGIRIALGAGPSTILRLVARSAVFVTGTGVLIGLGVAAVVARALRGMLFGVAPNDPVTFVSVAVLFAGAVILASYVPARRATTVDPVVALRAE